MTYEILEKTQSIVKVKLYSKSMFVAKKEYANMIKDLGIREVVSFKWNGNPDNRREAILEINF